LGLLDLIAGREILIARQHKIPLAALSRIEPEARLLRALGGDADLAVLRHVGNAGILQALLHRFADLRAGAAQKALAVRQALALGIKTTVDEIGHVYAAPPPRLWRRSPRRRGEKISGERIEELYPALFTRMYHSTRRRT
jgi:hypothetical protein